MNAEDLYTDREDLMTAEELEDFYHDHSSENIPTLTPSIREWLLINFEDMPSPDVEGKVEFLKRKPAMGTTVEMLEELRKHYNILPPGVQQRNLYNILRSKMLRQLIPCTGVTTLEGLLYILKKELESGIPAPIPNWYKFSKKKWGPRNFLGLEECHARGCSKTESADEKNPYSRCSNCKLVCYCCKDCQVTDWKARHKQVCKNGKKQRDMTKRAAEVIAMFSKQFDNK
mmetsp:Transcript_8033/g.10078  ORF Transcript_8033/g.10078 Transcript_8033/m.10078 type:complete len:229 (+) Transcript_8033:31-717(+)